MTQTQITVGCKGFFLLLLYKCKLFLFKGDWSS